MISGTTIYVKSGETLTVKFTGSAGGTTLSFDDNTDYAHFATYLGSLDGEQFVPMTQQFMQAWQLANTDLYMQIDATRFGYTDVLELTNISIDVDNFSILQIKSERHTGNFVHSSAFDVNELKAAVQEQCFELSKSAEDNAAWPVKYYRSTLVKNIDILSNYELKSIQNSDSIKTVPVFFPHTSVLGKLDFDQFGLKYDEITSLHILSETFSRIYNDKFARPDKCDIIYIDFLDQYFEVTDIDDVKTPANAVLYYDVKLALITDRKNVAKDEDLLNLTDLLTGNSQQELAEAKQPEKPAIVSHTAKTWKHQRFEQAQALQIAYTDNHLYGICWYDNQWQKFEQHDVDITLTTLSGNSTTVSIDDIQELDFAKFASFDKQLNDFDKNMYYTSYQLPRTLQPLLLIELVELI